MNLNRRQLIAAALTIPAVSYLDVSFGVDSPRITWREQILDYERFWVIDGEVEVAGGSIRHALRLHYSDEWDDVAWKDIRLSSKKIICQKIQQTANGN